MVFQEDVLFKALSKKNSRDVESGENSRVVELEMNSEEKHTEMGVEQDSSEIDREAGGLLEEDETDESPMFQD